MVRKSASLMVSVIMMALISACVGAPVVGAPTPQPLTNGTPQSTQIAGAMPSLVIPPTRTIFPAAGPTLDHSFQVGVTYAGAAPTQIGRFTLNKSKSYVDKGGRGVVLIYELNGLELSATLWLTDNTNDAVDRFNVETGLIQVEKIPVPVGDQAVVSPTNKAGGLRPGQNQTVWAEMRFRNTVLILYPSADMIIKVTDFSKDEAVDILTKLLAALPNK